MISEFLQLFINGFLIGGIYVLISIGLCLIFGVVEVINFAHGEFLMISMYLVYWLFYYFGFDPYLSILFIAPILYFIGIITQRILIQPLLNSPPLSQIFVTIGLSLFLQNLALVLWRSNYRAIRVPYSFNIFVGDLIINFPRLLACLAALGLTSVLLLFLRRTYTGKAIRALAQDKKASALVGIDVYKTYRLTFGIGAMCVGIAGAVLVTIYNVFPTVGTMFGLTAFAVVIVGGYNSLQGTIVAGFIIGLVESFSGFYISPHLSQAFYFVLVILVLIYRPYGILGTKES